MKNTQSLTPMLACRLTYIVIQKITGVVANLVSSLSSANKSTQGRILCIVIMSSLMACGGGGDSSTKRNDDTDEPVITLPAEAVTPSSIEEAMSWYLRDVSQYVIVPAYDNLAIAATALNTQATDFCALNTKTTSDLRTVQTAWQLANAAWQHIQWLQLGPLLQDNRHFKMQFWPDDNAAVQRGLDRLIADNVMVTPELIANFNVGAQGFPALEKILFINQAASSLLTADNTDFRCSMLTSITQNVVTMTASLYSQWQSQEGNYAAQLVTGTGDYTSVKDALEELANVWLLHIERVKDEKINKVLSKVSIAEAPESNESANNIQVNSQVYSQIYTAAGHYGLDDILLYLSQDNINLQIEAALSQVEHKASSLDLDLNAVLELPADQVAYTELSSALSDLRTLLNIDLVQALDLALGFNADDGD